MVTQGKKHNLVLVMILYLLGIFMGAIDTGIVTPARTVIQNNLNVDEKTGIWMITIYTLAYAASIPIMGKLADKYGRKYIYLTSILLFGVGSLFCGMAENFGSFTVLLIARSVQAIGGGGILPIATAEFGTTFPKEKRGMALGLVGGVYGIANIFGASAGSAILDIFGTDNWQFIFYINVPITLFILIAGFYALPNTKEVNVKKIDIFGITVLTAMVLSILYGLKNIDFFEFTDTIKSTSVYPFLLIFVVLIPLFIFVEKKAEDPVMNLSYFKNLKIIITLIIGFITGITIMGMIFVPQFAENALKVETGSGGYFVIILGLFAGIGAPFSGKLIDKFGVKIVLGTGFIAAISGSLFLTFVATRYPNIVTVVVSLILIGIGIGFTMGTPLNYMMLDNTKAEESNSALATLSLIRSVGTAIAPAIMIGFIAHAGISAQDNVMGVLPKEVTLPPLPYAQELDEQMDEMKTNPTTKDTFEKLNIPRLSDMQKIEINMEGDGSLKVPDDIVNMMQSSDVTTIKENTKKFSAWMFETMKPRIITASTSGIDKGISSLKEQISGLDMAVMGMAGSPGSEQKVQGMKAAKTSMEDTVKKMQAVRDAIPAALETGNNNYLSEIDNKQAEIEKEFQDTLSIGFAQVYATVAIVSALGLILLLLYRKNKNA